MPNLFRGSVEHLTDEQWLALQDCGACQVPVASALHPEGQFALSLQHKDLRLILSEADEVSVPMPATAAAQQMYTAALTKGMDEDFSIMIKFMEQLAGVSEEEHLSIH